MKRLFFLIFSLCWFTITPAPTSAQDDVFYVFNQAEAITFYQVDAAGEMTQVGALPPNIGIRRFAEVEWTIPVPADITISPDQRHVAFIAYRDEEDVDLFVYSLETDTLTQVDLPGAVTLHWSPVGDALFMSLPEIYYEFPTRAAGYLYDLTSNSLTMVPDFPAPAWLVTWLPDNETLVFTGPCVTLCNGWHDIYKLDRNSLSVSALTNHGMQLPPDVDIFICGLAWSEAHQRLYYEVGCPEFGAPYFGRLYSVDIAGTVRLEADLSETFTENIATQIVAIHPTVSGDIFLTIELHRDLNAAQGTVENGWRFIRVTAPEQFTTVLNYSRGTGFSSFLVGSTLSPDSQLIALHSSGAAGTTFGNLIVINLDHDTIVQDLPDLQPVCQATWLNEQTLVYVEYVIHCHPWTEPDTMSMLNVETGVVTPVAQDLPGFTWLMLSR